MVIPNRLLKRELLLHHLLKIYSYLVSLLELLKLRCVDWVTTKTYSNVSPIHVSPNEKYHQILFRVLIISIRHTKLIPL